MVHKKLIYRQNCLKTEAGGLGQFANLREGLGKKEGGRVFMGGGRLVDTPMHTMNLARTLTVILSY